MHRARLLLWAVLLSAATAAVQAVPREQRELDFVMQRTPDAAHGADLYRLCAACHGADGAGISDGSVPAIGGQVYAVVAKQLVDFRAGVRKDSRMEHFTDASHLAYSQDIADVAAYISTSLKARPWRIVDSAEAARGASLYTNQCERCHGPVAEGDEDKLMPRLAGQRSAYITSQITAPAGARRAMDRPHAAFRARLTASDVRALAIYLSGDTAPDQTDPGDSP